MALTSPSQPVVTQPSDGLQGEPMRPRDTETQREREARWRKIQHGGIKICRCRLGWRWGGGEFKRSSKPGIFPWAWWEALCDDAAKLSTLLLPSFSFLPHLVGLTPSVASQLEPGLGKQKLGGGV